MITFNPKKHEYTRDGIIVPNVSMVLFHSGLVDFRMVPSHILEASMIFGIAVHKACELYDLHKLDEAILDPVLRPYLDGWIKFEKDFDLSFEPEEVEQIIFHPKLWYAGRPDRIKPVHEIRSVIDIKSGSVMDVAAAIQTAAYMEADNVGKPRKEHTKNRYIVRLCGDGTYKLAPKSFFQKSDFDVFRSALTVTNWRGNHGKLD